MRRALLLAGCLATALAACGRETPPLPVRAVAPSSAPRPRESRGVEPDSRADAPTAEAAALLPPEQRPYVATRSFAGRVVDTHGRPVAGARVWFGDASTLTAKDGAFRLDGVEAKSAYAQATAPGFAAEKWETWPGREDLAVTIRRVVRVRGVVVHPDGTTAGGAEFGSAEAGADGAFEIDIREGTDAAFAKWGTLPGCAEGFTAASGFARFGTDPDHPPGDVRVVLDTRWSWIGARAVRADGDVAKDARVGVHVPGGSWWWYGTSDGEAAWAVPVPPGTEVELGVETEERGVVLAKGSARASTLPGAGAYADVELHAVETPPVATKVVSVEPERVALEFAVSDARDLERGPLCVWIGGPGLASLTTDRVSAGRQSLSFGRVRPGSYVVALYPAEWTDGDERYWVRHFDVRAGVAQRVVCDGIEPLRALRGRVVGPDGKPLAGSSISVREYANFPNPTGGRTCTDAAGRFDVNFADADYCWLCAHRDGFAPAFVRVDPRAGGDAEIRLERGGTIEFHLADGDSVASYVTIESQAGDLRFSASAPRVGDFESILHVPAGRWTVREERTQKPRAATVDVRDGETTVVKLAAE